MIEFPPPQMVGGDDEHLTAFEDRLIVVISSDYLQSWCSPTFTVQTWLCWPAGLLAASRKNLIWLPRRLTELRLQERSVQICPANVLLLYSFSVWGGQDIINNKLSREISWTLHNNWTKIALQWSGMVDGGRDNWISAIPFYQLLLTRIWSVLICDWCHCGGVVVWCVVSLSERLKWSSHDSDRKLSISP